MRVRNRPVLRAIAGLALGAAFAACGLPAADPASAQDSPAIRWEQARVKARVIAGRKISVTVQFFTFKPVERAVFDLAEENLDVDVRFSPSEYRNLDGRVTRPVTITFDSTKDDSETVREIGGIVAKASRAADAPVLTLKPLTYLVDVLDRGDLVGADDNGNGDWDYIANAVQRTFQTRETRLAGRAFGRALQTALEGTATDPPIGKREHRENAARIEKAIECLVSLEDPAEDFTGQIAQLKAAILNNFARHFAYVEFSRQVANSTRQAPLDDTDSCPTP